MQINDTNSMQTLLGLALISRSLRGLQNVALNRWVTASTEPPFGGTLSQLVDGDKEATEDCLVELDHLNLT